MMNFSSFKGKKILLVNVASECMYTPQYEQMEALNKHSEESLVVVGVPCNDFGGQEPGNEQAIQRFCETNFKVSFPMTEKIQIKAPNTHDLYKFATTKALNGKEDNVVQWNFQKFLFDENGQLQQVFDPADEPLGDKVLEACNIQL